MQVNERLNNAVDLLARFGHILSDSFLDDLYAQIDIYMALLADLHAGNISRETTMAAQAVGLIEEFCLTIETELSEFAGVN